MATRLKYGSTGSEVRYLQEKLRGLGYYNGKIDGIYGLTTVAAVKRFQQNHGLAADGIAGNNFNEKLKQVSEKRNSSNKSGISGSDFGSNSGSSSGSGSSGSSGGSSGSGGSGGSGSAGGSTSNTTSTTTTTSKTSTVTLMEGSAPTVAKDELRIGIQTKPITVSKSTKSSETTSTKTTSGSNTINKSTTTTTTTTVDTTATNFYYPPIEGDVTWDTERSGSPGKVTFKVRADIPITEGDIVSITYGDTKVFVGYIFEHSVDKTGVISVTAYDQTKYFNNSDTYVFENIKASDVLKRIANDYSMTVGTIEDTGIVIPSIVEDNQTLFDIVYNALDKTVAAGTKVFVFYDDYGKLTLKSLDSMRVNLLLCEDTVGDYEYRASIDDETFNQIVLYHDDDKTKKRQYFSASSKENINQWGLLRKTEKIDSTNGAQKLADLYLAMYNKKTRKLSIKDAFGRPDVRAGTLVPVIMKVGDVNLSNFMLVEKASHTWSNGKYFMNLDLAGAGEFSV